MIIVLDTNVIVSGLLTPFGASSEIVRMVSAGALILEYDSRILFEYEDVLHRPRFQFDKDLVDAILEYIKRNGHVISASPLKKQLPDPDDAPFLEVAVAGRSDYLVTGNIKHYPEKSRKGIKVISQTEFIRLYQKIEE